MKKELKDNWVKALRSGEYKQGRGQLCMDEKYCCLGVLCEVYGLTGRLEGLNNNERSYLMPGGVEGDYRQIYSIPDTSVFGLDRSIACTLVNMNDDQCRNFTEIAEYIEDHVEVTP